MPIPYYDQYGRPIDKPKSIQDWDFNYGQGSSARALQKLGLNPDMLAANPGYFGGTEGIVKNKIWQLLDPMNQTYELYGGSPTSNSGKLRDAMPDGLSSEAIRQLGNDAPQAWRDLVAEQDSASKAVDPLPGFFQLSPEHFSGVGAFDKIGGRSYIDDLSGVKYDPRYGYIAPESAFKQSKDPSADPSLRNIALVMALAGGVGALNGGIGGAAGGATAGNTAGAGALSSGSLEALAAGANYGGISALPGAAATGGFNAGAGAFGGSGFLGSAAAAAGTGGNMSWWDDISNWGSDLFGSSPTDASSLFQNGSNYQIATPDMFGAPNSLFPANSSLNPGLLSQLGVGEASQMTLAPWADALAGGASFADLAPWIQAGAGSAPGFFNQLGNAYDQYGKPIKQAYDAFNGATGQGGGIGGALRGFFGGGSGGTDWASLLGSGASAILTNSQKQAIEGATTTATDMADPFAKERPQYQGQLRNLMTNPAALEGNAAFQNMFNTGLEAVNRTASAKGQLQSGNRLTDLMDYGQKKASEFYFPQAQLLAGLGGATAGSPAAAGQFKLEGTSAAQGLRSKQAADLFGMQPRQQQNSSFSQFFNQLGR